MNMTENKLRYLEMIQNIITRMAKNSFTIKGWVITIVSAIFIFAKTSNLLLILSITYLPILLFWLLDAYYLSLERKYRNLYNYVLTIPSESLTYELKPKNGENSGICNSFLSKSVMPFYLLFLIIDLFICKISV